MERGRAEERHKCGRSLRCARKGRDKAGTLEYIFEISGESVSVDLVFDGDVDTAGLADYVVLCFTKWVHV